MSIAIAIAVRFAVGLQAMTRATDQELLARLKDQRRRLDDRLHKIQARQKKQDRVKDTRQKVLLGAFLRTWMDRDDEMRRRVMVGLDRYLTRDIDRVHFDLELRDDGTLKKDAIPKAQPKPKKDAAAITAALAASAEKAS